MNPGYLGELRALTAPRARAFDGGGILDVLGIEVDGVDIAAGVGEAEVLVAVDELLAALRHLANGSPAAQATVGRGPTELVLEARGADVRLARPGPLRGAGLGGCGGPPLRPRRGARRSARPAARCGRGRAAVSRRAGALLGGAGLSRAAQPGARRGGAGAGVGSGRSHLPA